MKDLSIFFCPNPQCAEFEQRGQGNLRVHDHYGPHKNRLLLYCRICGERFSETRNTLLFQAKLPAEKVESVVQHLAEGNGLRKTSRLTKVNYKTVERYALLAGEHGQRFQEERLRNLEVEEAQVDEKWSFVGKKRGPLHGGGSA